MRVTGQRVEKMGIGGRARTMAGAGPTDPLPPQAGVPGFLQMIAPLGPCRRFRTPPGLESPSTTGRCARNPNQERGGAGRNPSPTANNANSSQEERGETTTRTRTHPSKTPARAGVGYRNPNPSTTRTQAHTPHHSRKPSVHSPGTEAAHAMQVTRLNEIRSPGVRLHAKACAALGLEADRATPERLRTPVPRTCMHALGTGYARKSSELLGFRSKGGTCASTGAHSPGETSTSHWRRSALPVLPRAAMLVANSQV